MVFFISKTLVLSYKTISIVGTIVMMGVLASCNGPERLPYDVTARNSLDVISDRVLAPLSIDPKTAPQLPKKSPRRQLLQLRYNERSLENANFIESIRNLAASYNSESDKTQSDRVQSETADGASDNTTLFNPWVPQNSTSGVSTITTAEHARISTIRANQRREWIIREGLRLEQALFTNIQDLEGRILIIGDAFETTLFTQLSDVERQIRALEEKAITSGTAPPPRTVFGHTISRNSQGFLALPPEVALLVRANDGVVSSKITPLRGKVENPVMQISFSQARLGEVIRFICTQAGLPVLISDAIDNNRQLISLNVEAGILSTLDALFSQYNISVIYDPALEVAQVYTDEEFKARISTIGQAIEAYNASFFDRQNLTRLNEEKAVLDELITSVRQLTQANQADTTGADSITGDSITSDSITGDSITGDSSIANQGLHKFNRALTEQRGLARLLKDKHRLIEMVALVQTMLSGEADSFLEGFDRLSRTAGDEIVLSSLNMLSLDRLAIASRLKKFDDETTSLLTQKTTPLVQPIGLSDGASIFNELFSGSHGSSLPAFNTPAFNAIAIIDPCIQPGREVITEKISVYGGNTAFGRIKGITEALFETLGPSPNPNANNTGLDGSVTATQSPATQSPAPQSPTESPAPQSPASITPFAGGDLGGDLGLVNSPVADFCTEDPAKDSPKIIQLDAPSDDSIDIQFDPSFIVTGLIEHVNLFHKIVEQYDRAPKQVLVEVFVINVTKDFARRLDTSLQTDASASSIDEVGNSFLRRDLTNLSQSVTSSTTGGFVAGLISASNDIQVLVDFIETNRLGRTISSPTLLIEEGKTGLIQRTLEKRVELERSREGIDPNGNPIPLTETNFEVVDATFTLDIQRISVNPQNNNVTMDFSMTDKVFDVPLAEVNVDTGTATDTITSSFTSAPGDVIVLAGLFRQSDSVDAQGLPGTTTTNLPTAFVLGGEDNTANSISEMMILLVPTVIDPEIGKTHAHSSRRFINIEEDSTDTQNTGQDSDENRGQN